MDPRSVFQMDATRDAIASAFHPIVAGFPLVMSAGAAPDKGNLGAVSLNAGDVFYGVSGTNRNPLYGATSLGEFTPGKVVAYLAGIVTIRQSVFLDSTNTEVTINPFVGGSGANGFPDATDVGKTVIVDDVAPTAAEQALLGVILLNKWSVAAPGAGGGTHPIHTTAVATILEVRENAEVDLLIPSQVSLAS
jgi:hypothetical protein